MTELVGQSLGKYHLLELLGQGGMAQVYQAAQLDLARYVAVKVIHNRHRSDEAALDTVENFEREAIALAGLSHPNIVPIFDFGRTDDLYYMVMALIQGPTLQSRLKQLHGSGQTLPLPEIVSLFQALAGAIDYAHSQHIIHRDLKPANIMFTSEGRVVLTDFGVARLLTLPDEPNRLVGTPAYMSPEQALSQPTHKASDIYSLGVILYQLVTGRLPFEMTSPMDILKHVSEQAPPPTTVNPELPPAVEPVIVKALSKAPEARFASALALVQALAEACGVYSLPLTWSLREDWGDAPDVSRFYGRQQSLLTLEQWVVSDQCRLVGILGLGGIGKTTLAVKLAEQIKDHFDTVIWRSLRDAVPPEELLDDWLTSLARASTPTLPSGTGSKLGGLMRQLRRRRCLLLLDNVESILADGPQAGRYRSGYEPYGDLFRQLAESRHQSCLILTSRVKPAGLALSAQTSNPARMLRLQGLDTREGRALLSGQALSGSDKAWQTLVERYSGNPLALKLVAETVNDVFAGSLTDFLGEASWLLDSVSQLLTRQFERLSFLEQEILLWLAIEREQVTPETLANNLLHPTPRSTFVTALQNLRRRSLVEQGSDGFSLQNMVLEFLTAHLVNQVYREIAAETPGLLRSHALLKAQTKTYLRQGQTRLIVQPLIARLLAKLGPTELTEQLKALLATQRGMDGPAAGYIAGNILNLLVHSDLRLAEFDFSQQQVRQAYLAGVAAQDINFTGATLTETVFTDTFGGILSLAYSPDGQTLAAGTTRGEVRVWQVGSGQALFNFEGHANWVQSVAYSPNGRILASGGTDQTIRLWDLNTCQALRQLSTGHSRIRAVIFTPDSNYVFSAGSDKQIKQWDVTTGQVVATFLGHTEGVLSLALSRDGQCLASSSQDGTVRLWNVADGKCRHIFKGHTTPIWAVALSRNGRTLASASDDQTLRLWDIEAAKCRHILTGHTDGVKCVAFTAGGRILASGGNDGTVRLWAVDSGKLLQTLTGHDSMVWALAFNPNRQTLVSGDYNQTIRTWEVASGRCLQIWRGYAHWVSALTYHPSGVSLATGEEDGQVRIWNVEQERVTQTLSGHSAWISALGYSHDGRWLASGSADKTLRVWRNDTGQCEQLLYGHTDRVWAVAFSGNDRLLASGSEDESVRLWEVDGGRCVNTLQGHAGRVRSVAFHPEQPILASGSDDKTIRLWTADSGQLLHTLQGHVDWVMSVQFSPDGRWLASGSADRTVRLWDIETWQCLMILQAHAGRARTVAFAPDGWWLASGGDDHLHQVRVWNLETGQAVQTLEGHTDLIKAISFGPAGRTLASCSDDGTTKIWNVVSGQCLRTLQSDRPYERMNISGVRGLTAAQKTALKALGAVAKGEREQE